MLLHKPPIALTAISAALLLAACGGASGDGAHGGGHAASESVAEPVDGASEVTVNAVDIDFKPESIEIVAGEPVNVTVVNEGQTLHDFTLEEADVHVNVEAGEQKTTSMTIDEPGRYEALCTVESHAEAGMTVAVVVAAP